MTLAADLELDGRGLLGLLDASRAGVLAAADLDEVLDVGHLACCAELAKSRLSFQANDCWLYNMILVFSRPLLSAT